MRLQKKVTDAQCRVKWIFWLRFSSNFFFRVFRNPEILAQRFVHSPQSQPMLSRTSPLIFTRWTDATGSRDWTTNYTGRGTEPTIFGGPGS